MSFIKIIFVLLALLVLSLIYPQNYFSVPLSLAASDDAEKADKLGEEFQKQAPWFREKPQGDEGKGEPQPELYIHTPEGKEEKQDKYPYCRYPDCPEQYPLCYNPDLEVYEYCYPADSSDFRLRFHSPKFRLWWEHERVCPPGYFFTPGSGCSLIR